jgi:hypothetical protein
LVIAPMLIMAAEHREGCSEVFFTEKDKPAQTLLLDRTNKAFRSALHCGTREVRERFSRPRIDEFDETRRSIWYHGQ